MEEGDALRNYCREMISRVRGKRQQLETPAVNEDEEERRRHKHRGVGRDGDRGSECDLSRDSFRPTHQGPPAQPVPPQLLSLLKLKTFKEQMRRAAEVELHDPALCSDCEQKQASLALKTFIRRKKTQLRIQALTERLNTRAATTDFTTAAARPLPYDVLQTPRSHAHAMGFSLPSEGPCVSRVGKCFRSPPMPRTGFGRNYSVEICGSQQPVVAIATTKERGVALATDEMRGYPDKNTTGTHLARPRCPFSDR